MGEIIFGFDLGIASIGWAVIEIDDENKNPEEGLFTKGEIIGTGVRTFSVAEDPQKGESLAKPRRDQRLSRRARRRKVRRKEGIKSLFVSLGLVKKDELEGVFLNQIGGDVWDLRVKELSQKLEKEELFRVIFHLAKHRGFKSYRKSEEENDKETGKVLKAIKKNKEYLTENKTLAQVIVEKAGGNGKKRNYTCRDKNGKDEAIYINSIPRDEIKKELKAIYEYQKQYGIFTKKLYEDLVGKGENPKDDDKNENGIMFRHRPVRAIDKMIGICRFEKDQKRAPKEAPSSEIFVALGKINNLVIYENNEKRFLNKEKKNSLLELLKNTKEVKYSTISSKIFKNKEIKFADINYKKTTKKDKKGNEKEIKSEDENFYSMKGWHKIKSELKDNFCGYSSNLNLLDKIVVAIASFKNDVLIEKEIKDLVINNNHIELFKKLTLTSH